MFNVLKNVEYITMINLKKLTDENNVIKIDYYDMLRQPINLESYVKVWTKNNEMIIDTYNSWFQDVVLQFRVEKLFEENNVSYIINTGENKWLKINDDNDFYVSIHIIDDTLPDMSYYVNIC